MKMKKSFLATLALATSLLPAQSNYAGIPVIDGTNLVQTIITATESVSQTLKQIEEYGTQLLQYENQLLHTLSPQVYIWDQAKTTIDDILKVTDTLSFYQNQVGSIGAYLGKFKDVEYYRSSPCFSSAGCSKAEWALLDENRRLASESQKRANDALFKGIERQQINLKNDAERLLQLQAAAKDSRGQLEAIGYANQLASNQSAQLMQIRSVLIAQQNATASEMQAETDKEAQQEAASKQVRTGEFVPSPTVNW